jgi:ribosome maturation factor RimP
MAGTLRDQLIALLEPLIVGLGYELVDLDFAPGRGSAHVTVYIDRAAGIGIEDCELCSREMSALLDVHDPIPQAYTLEVSSPGLDRVLRTPQHYLRFVGARVQIELQVPRDGRRRYTGKLLKTDATGIELEVDGVGVAAGYGEIARTRLVPEWPEQTRKGRRR